MEEITPENTASGFSGADLAEELLKQSPETKASIASDPRAIEIRDKIHEARTAGNVKLEKQLVEEARATHFAIKSEMEKQQGTYISLEEKAANEERERLDKLALIQEQLTGAETDEELLKKFGMIDEEGQPTLASPLFRGSTRRAFDRYIKSVMYWKAAQEAPGVSIRNQGRADATRTEMHDEVARNAARDLGIDFEAARSLVAKVRDGRVPGSGESRLYARRAAKELEKYQYDVAQFMSDQQKDVHNLLEDTREVA